MQRRDAERLVADLINRTRSQTEDLLKELERVAREARSDVEDRARGRRKQATQAARRARKQVEGSAERATRVVRDAADRPLANVDKLRRQAGVGPNFPISAYDQLTAPQIKSRVGDLTPAELRKVRDYEKRNQARKGVLTAVEKKLG